MTHIRSMHGCMIRAKTRQDDTKRQPWRKAVRANLIPARPRRRTWPYPASFNSPPPPHALLLPSPVFSMYVAQDRLRGEINGVLGHRQGGPVTSRSKLAISKPSLPHISSTGLAYPHKPGADGDVLIGEALQVLVASVEVLHQRLGQDVEGSLGRRKSRRGAKRLLTVPSEDREGRLLLSRLARGRMGPHYLQPPLTFLCLFVFRVSPFFSWFFPFFRGFFRFFVGFPVFRVFSFCYATSFTKSGSDLGRGEHLCVPNRPKTSQDTDPHFNVIPGTRC